MIPVAERPTVRVPIEPSQDVLDTIIGIMLDLDGSGAPLQRHIRTARQVYDSMLLQGVRDAQSIAATRMIYLHSVEDEKLELAFPLADIKSIAPATPYLPNRWTVITLADRYFYVRETVAEIRALIENRGSG